LGTRRGVCLPGDSEREIGGGLWKRSSLSLSLYQSSVRGTWRLCSFTWDPEGYVKEGCGNITLSP